jgi:hypothetical protein
MSDSAPAAAPVLKPALKTKTKRATGGANISRQMNRVVETFGAEQVRAWVKANLDDSYPATMYGSPEALQAMSAGNRRLICSAERSAATGGKRVLFCRNVDDLPSSSEDEAAHQPKPKRKRKKKPEVARGAFSLSNIALW